MEYLILFISGFIFSMGLVLSGMTNTDNVIGFLDVTNNWNPALLLVMIGAIGTHGISYFFISKRKTPLFSKSWHLPQKTDFDAALIIGSILFGIGWGLTGICPGPSIIALVALCSTSSLMFFASMVAGFLLFRRTKQYFK